MVVMPVPREKWTDERLDDLNKKVDQGFADTKAEIADTKAEMRAGFARVDTEIRELRSEMNSRFDKVDERFDRLQQTLIGGFAVMVAAFVGSTATLAGIALL
jgi:hypothetical protein